MALHQACEPTTEQMILKCMEYDSYLTDWEYDFINDLADTDEDAPPFHPNTITKLKEIFEKVEAI